MTKQHIVGKAGGRFGRASLAALLSVAVAGAFTPVAAFGAAATATESNPYYNADGTYNHVLETYDASSGKYSYPEGAWVETDNDANTYEWLSTVPGDNSHYGTYGLKVTFTVEDKVLTAVDATGVPSTFGGLWGTQGSKGAAVIGYLPDGVTATAASGRENLTIALEGASTYAPGEKILVNKIDLYTLAADGTASAAEGTSTYSSTTLGNAVDDDYITWTPTATHTYEQSGRTGTTTVTTTESGTLSVKSTAANMVGVNYKIGQNYTFTVYYALDGNDSAVASYVKANTTAIDTQLSNMGQTNKSNFSTPAITVLVQRELKSWLNSLTKGTAGEMEDLDTVSGATKTSEPMVEALYAAQGYSYPIATDSTAEATKVSGWEQLFTSVADGVVLTIDGEEVQGDTTSVTTNSAGQYVMENNLVGSSYTSDDDDGDESGPQANTVYLYSFDKQLTSTEMWNLAKGTEGTTDPNAANLVSSYELQTDSTAQVGQHSNQPLITADYGDISYDATSKLWTVKNSKANYLVFKYTIGHSELSVAYDLAGVCEATRINTEVAAGVTASSAAKLKSAYNALTTDAKGFVTASTLATLNTYQSITVKKATATVKASAVKKKAKTLSFTVSGAKTALKVGSLTKAQKKGISKVKVSGNKVKVTLKKGAKKGTYKLKVAAKAANGYKASSKQTITVKVK